MDGNSDRIVMLLIGVALTVWVIYQLFAWLQRSPRSPLAEAIPLNEDIEPHPALGLLDEAGYEVIGGKLKIPLSFHADNQTYYSRLFVDYVAEGEDGSRYLVLISRPRRPLEWTGSGLRDKLLPYLLLYPECSRLLYVDMQTNRVSVIGLGKDEGEAE